MSASRETKKVHIKEYIYKEINIMRNYLVKRNNEGNDLDFLDDAFNSFFKPMFYEEKFNTMKTDIKETETGYVMDIEVPGFDKKDVNISLGISIVRTPLSYLALTDSFATSPT